MSKEGVQNHLKNGGAHVDTHETSLLLRNCENSPENTRKASIWEDLATPTNTQLIQDGGAGDVIVQEPSFGDFNFDTGQLSLENPSTDDITGIIVGNFPTSASIASREWLKSSTCVDSVCKVEFQSVNAALLESMGSDSVPDAKNEARELGDLFSISAVPDIGSHLAPEIPFTLSDGLPLPTSMAHSKLAAGNCHSSPVSPINFLEETPVCRSRSYSDTENDEKIQTKAFLEELERGSQLTAEDKELMELSRKELQAYEFQVLQQDKSNLLLTPQELENLPVQGLEFEEVAVPQSPVVTSVKTESINSDSFVDNDPSTEIVKSSMSFISTTSDKNSEVTPVIQVPQHLLKVTVPRNVEVETATASISQVLSTDASIDSKVKNTRNVKHTSTVKNTRTLNKKNQPIKNLLQAKNILREQQSKKPVTMSASSTPYTTVLKPDVVESFSPVEAPTISIPESSLAKVVLMTKNGTEETFEVDQSQLIPVQVGDISNLPVPQKPSPSGCAAADNGRVVLSPAASNNIHLTAVPMLYVKDGCLVIPIQQVQTITDPGSSAASSETAAAAASVSMESADAASHHANMSTAAPGRAGLVAPPAQQRSVAMVARSKVGQGQVMKSGNGSYHIQKGSSLISPVKKNKSVSINKHKMVVDTRDKWTCNVCSARFPRLYKLKLHLMKHTGEKPFKCSHPDCKWAFTTAFKLKRHMECHLGKKDYICEVAGCGKQFTTIYNLNTHKKSHLRRCTMECPTCAEKFSTQRQLDYHMRAKSHGEKELTYECPHEGCGRKFFSRYCMGSHMRVHLHNQKYPCPAEGCNRLFDKQCRLQQHMRSHTGEKPYRCSAPDCGAAFATQSKLKRHARKHTGERRWVCDVEGCGKAFMRSEHLRAHTITHTGEKPFECNIPGCNSRFKCKSSLYVHLKRHSENAKKKDDPNCACKPSRNKYTNKAALNMRNNYNRQLQNALGDLFTLINAEELESLISSQVDQQTSTGEVTTTSESFVNSISTAPITPADIDILSVNLDGQQAIITNVPPTVTTLPNNYVAHQGGATSLLTNATNLTQADLISQGLINNTGLSLIQEGIGPIINITPTASGRVALKNKPAIASTRTEFLSGRVKKKKVDKTIVDLGLIKDMKGTVKVEGGLSTTGSAPSTTLGQLEDATTSTTVVNPNEIVTSRAITFRDPETGAIYVQTQLLQDDPPNPDIYSDSVVCLDTSEPLGLGVDLPGMLLDTSPIDISESTGALEFTGTTINLQDLE